MVNVLKWHNSGTVDNAQSSTEQATSHNVRQKLSTHQKRKKQIKQTIDYYMENARILRESLTELGLTVYGGENAPYLWVKTPADAPLHGSSLRTCLMVHRLFVRLVLASA